MADMIADALQAMCSPGSSLIPEIRTVRPAKISQREKELEDLDRSDRRRIDLYNGSRWISRAPGAE